MAETDPRSLKYKGRSSRMTRSLCLLAAFSALLSSVAQNGGNAALRAQADALFAQEKFAEAMPQYAQLVSLDPSDHDLNYKLGTCVIHSGDDKEPAIGFLTYAVKNANIPPLAWYYLGRAYHLTYRFKDALDAYQHFRGTEDKKALATHPVDALEQQCRNGLNLLTNLKEVTVHDKVEVDDAEFFRFYELGAIGGRIVVTPPELQSALDRKSGERSLTYLPDKGGRIYFSSRGKDNENGRDIYVTTLLPDGRFDEPMRLAGYINTDQDEDFAFLAPDGKTFYFCSKGHNSMGGYDVFRSTYDPGLEVYGPPVNLDFAVNTPDDDIFYMVDPEGKEACFASARDSRQGLIHVYRVSTAQQPLVLTVIKGTFASEIDPADRAARIVVEDAVTHEQVADVRSDIDGEYVLSLPRNGRYKFMVEAGPTGRTHVGMVEVPRSENPRAYRQELSLRQQAGAEQLVIRNYFDEPLPDDLIALALDEIKRRARLDVTTSQPVAQAPVEEPPVDDVMTAAGFTGDVTKEQALRLAREDAMELEQQAARLDDMSGAAHAVAVQALAEADAAAAEARTHLAEAGTAGDEEARNKSMMAAAEARQRSRKAVVKARAAIGTGNDLGAEHARVGELARGAHRLADDLALSLKGTNTGEQLDDLRQLKSRLDEKQRPESDIDPVESARRTATASEQEAARALASANAERAEEDDLTDHVNRLKREREQTHGGGRKEQLDREITEYEGYRDAMHEEVEAAFGKARKLEEKTELDRAKASLTQYLTTAEGLPGTDLDPAQIAAMTDKIDDAEKTLAAMPIDTRFDAMVLAQAGTTQRTISDWDMADAGTTGSPREATLTAGSDTNGQAATADLRETQVDPGARNGLDVRDAEVADVPVSSDGPDRATRMADPNGGQDTRPQDASATGTTTTQVAQDASVPTATIAVLNAHESAGAERQMDGSASVQANAPADVREQTFIVENQLAEARQLRAASRSRAQRDSLDVRIATIEQQLAQARAAATATVPVNEPVVNAIDTPEVVVAPIAFDRSATEELIIGEIFTSYAEDRRRIEHIADLDERNATMNGLELMLVDSITAQTDAQLAELEAHPEIAAEVLPRVDRLRMMKESHLRAADDALAASRRTVPADLPVEDERLVSAQPAAGVPRATSANAPARIEATAAGTRYVEVDPDPRRVYTSHVEHRAPKAIEAAAADQGTFEEIAMLDERIDSLELVLDDMPQGRAYDKLRAKTDRMIDDRMILRTEMGQRMEFISREEFQDGLDSLKDVRAEVMKAGLAPSEPLMVMARQMEEAAQQRFNHALQVRKKADRSEDIVERDSLFRLAYGSELLALRELDQAITVNNYVLSEHFDKGEAPTYVVIEQELFGLPEPETEDVAALESIRGRTPAGAVVEDQPAVGIVTAGTEPPTEQQGTTTANAQGTDLADAGTASAERSAADPGTTNGSAFTGAVPSTGVAVYEQTDLRAPASDRSRMLYGAYIAQDQQQTDLLIQETDPTVLMGHAVEADATSRAMEERSLALADRAIAVNDSASTVKKRDREAVEKEALRLQQLSDSLHRASLAHADSAQVFERLSRDAAQARLYDEALRKFYYLNGEEMALVHNDADHSRYFQMKVKALEQQQQAAAADHEAASARQLSSVLLEETKSLMIGTDGALPTQEAREKAADLNERAVQLQQRADSLERAADRFDAASRANDSQAAAILQAMPPDRGTDVMALEQAARRSEPFLAQAHSIAGEGMVDLGGIQRAADTEPQDAAAATGSQQAVAAATGTRSTGQEPARMEPSSGVTMAPAATGTGAPLAARPVTFDVPAALEEDIFSLRTPGERVDARIGVDQPKPAGLVFSVQIGAFRNPIPADLFSDIVPVMGESAGGGLTRYTAGLFDDYGAADRARGQVRDRGYRDAFVVAYRDGVRITLAEALRMQATPSPAFAQEPPVRPTYRSLDPDTVRIAAVPDSEPALIQRPSEIVQAEADTNLLQAYPSSAEAIVAQFKPAADAASYYNDPTAAPARQVEMVKGLFFTVQVGVYSKPVPLAKLFNIDPLNSERTETGKIRYTTGVFLDTERARERKDEAVTLGVKDAFVTAYLNGRRIPMVEARALLARHGSAILADPSIGTR